MKKAVLLAICVFVSGGCATITKGSRQVITLDSVPAGAKVSIMRSNGKLVTLGKTPYAIALKRGGGYFMRAGYKVKLEKDGFAPIEYDIKSLTNRNKYLYGNLYSFWALGWLLADPISGAMWDLAPGNVSIDLKTKKITAVTPSKELIESAGTYWTMEPAPDKAFVHIIMRQSCFGDIDIWDQTSFLGCLGKEAAVLGYLCGPGRHLFIFGGEKKVIIPAQLVANRSYYIYMDFNTLQFGDKGKNDMVSGTITALKKGAIDFDELLKNERKAPLQGPAEGAEKEKWEKEHAAEIKETISRFEKLPEAEKETFNGLDPEDGI